MPRINRQICETIDEVRLHFRIARPLGVNRKDGSVMLYVSAGEFEMGDGQEPDCPKHPVYLDAYWIGVYCVTNRQYAVFLEETKHRAPANQIWNQARYAQHPVVRIGWEDAEAYAKWAGCRLVTEAQWEKAARGPKGLIYPWGDDWDAQRCLNGSNMAVEETGTVWRFGTGVGGWGTYGQSGNVWEWCDDWYQEGYYGRSSGRNPKGSKPESLLTYRVCRGGCWGRADSSYFRGARRNRFDPSYRGADVGFRIAKLAT